MKCSKSVEKNIAHAEELVRQAAAKGAEIVLLPELFERPYFCQERRYEYYEYAQTVEENPAVRHFSRVAAELGIVIPVSFYEKEVNNTYNSVAVLDADGKNLGIYRKTHIPSFHKASAVTKTVETDSAASKHNPLVFALLPKQPG